MSNIIKQKYNESVSVKGNTQKHNLLAYKKKCGCSQKNNKYLYAQKERI